MSILRKLNKLKEAWTGTLPLRFCYNDRFSDVQAEANAWTNDIRERIDSQSSILNEFLISKVRH